MFPSLSVIIFTVLSGAGLGLLVLGMIGFIVFTQTDTFFQSRLILISGLVLLNAGLVSSWFHLGQRQRAWRGLTQWRSSWLSREAIAALMTNALGVILFVALFIDSNLATLRMIACAVTIFALLTLFCTARIYDTLKPIPAWNNQWVLPNFVLAALVSGAFCLWMIKGDMTTSNLVLCGGLLLALFFLKRAYWRFIDSLNTLNKAGHATGLEALGRARAVEAPHTERNYLLKEMGYVLARKHAIRLRHISVVFFTFVPMLSLVATWFGTDWVVIKITALSSLFAGLMVERWLFFAQAEHLVIAFYDTRRS
jgi:DMSO reductase anchor subunit